jgi:4-amino-4-deoxy-L-arabinose transferase-like glycosyltransferase
MTARGRIGERVTRHRFTLIVALAVAAGVLLRVWIFRSDLRYPDSDETVVGLMADAMRHGARPTFFWGQAYGGTLETAFTAVAFTVFGTSRVVLKLVPTVLGFGTAVLLWRAGRRVLGEPAARFAAALSLVYPPFFLWWSTKAVVYYAIAPLLCVAALLVVLRLREQAQRRGACSKAEVGALGVIAGLAFWTTPQTVFVIGPLVVWLAIRARTCWRDSWPAPIGFLAGVSPWLRWNLQHGWDSLETPLGVRDSTYVHRVGVFFTHGLPEMLGLRMPYTRAWRFGTVGEVLYVAVLLAFVAFVVLVLRRRDERTRALEPVLAVALAYPWLYAIAPTSVFTGEPRYTAMLVPIVVLLLGAGLRPVALQLGALVIAVVLALSMLHFLEGTNNREVRGPDVRPLVAVLDQLDARRVYGDYWLAYPIDFATRKRIVATPVDVVREPAIDAVVAAGDPSYYVLWKGGSRDRNFGNALRRIGVGFRRVAVTRFAVYALDRNLRPDMVPGGFWRSYGI